jgi:hypothetical protein
VDLGIVARRVAVGIAGLPAVLLLAACGFQEAICRSGEYPVMQVGGTGRQCVADGEEPPAGFRRYPAGQEPKHVDDKWDVYWRTHTIDQNGNVVQSR